VVNKANALGLKTRIAAEAIRPITTKEYPMPAPRPANSRLDTGKVMSTFKLTLPSWRDEVAQVLKTLINADGTVK
jgi:dTDP-4-dehydrorhamnose reductase